jgi:hypothetical protein
LNRGDWSYVGVRAAVDIPLSETQTAIRIESPGLWGIESDSGEDYFDSVFQEECDSLVGMLEELGVKVV